MNTPITKHKHLGNKPNVEKREVAAALYRTGLTIQQVADRMGITRQAAHGLLVRHGVERRPRGGNTGGHSRHRK